MPKTILVVDDSLTMTKSLKSNLEMSGFAVLTAGDGEEAIGTLRGGAKPDLIITDINMPRMDGLALIKAVKLLPGFRFTPILTLTTEGDGAKRDEGKRLGATGWLVKPIKGTDLIRVIKQVLPGA
ncbi:response regulator [Ideonella livida]|uniref:Response regulator n=1 Tax=Ideonella livida TaxID=2707176 RepID=A0A7C9PFF3_9BURK|nr:response regulator [Ideonella livida]NDY90495.1 response regulator [Ideonella livida]